MEFCVNYVENYCQVGVGIGLDFFDATNPTAWTNWVSRFENYLIATNITHDLRKRALLLHLVGPTNYKTFESLPNTGTTYREAKEALQNYFLSTVNTEYKRAMFRRQTQKQGESLEYHVRLRQSANNCDFHDIDVEIKSHIIKTMVDTKLQKQGLCVNMTLSQLLITGRTNGLTANQREEIENGCASTSSVKCAQRKVQPKCSTRPPKKTTKQKYHQSKQQSRKTTKCFNCGQPYAYENGFFLFSAEKPHYLQRIKDAIDNMVKGNESNIDERPPLPTPAPTDSIPEQDNNHHGDEISDTENDGLDSYVNIYNGDNYNNVPLPPTPLPPARPIKDCFRHFRSDSIEETVYAIRSNKVCYKDSLQMPPSQRQTLFVYSDAHGWWKELAEEIGLDYSAIDIVQSLAPQLNKFCTEILIYHWECMKDPVRECSMEELKKIAIELKRPDIVSILENRG
ncbi:uncharacterized protein LOC117100625 isoform X1 [Anneissia japonica]|uniref:uncharacterized protein LOC117100625 isoform X1 n=1 Tax=Anneissia japonica TaxID=1529436 RepID=UPI0014256A52|nr:uncharacterized protein LOC117100625 isoform X1 [Anneissia japonica]